jgi:hypothetical protein
MNLYKIRVTGEVLETAAATRRCAVDGQVLTFGREPVYLEASELPSELAGDAYLRIEEVESAPSGSEVLRLKAERIQEPADGIPEEEPALKAERIQEPEEAFALAGPPNRKRR